VLDGTLISDRFELRGVAGTGGMATVYRAIDRTNGSTVALKVLATAASAELARFDREARVLEALVHPNIVGYITRGALTDGRPYLVIEWLAGETLAARLGDVTPTIREAVELVTSLARALGHAHAAGVVHRDVKPSNVFLLGQGFSDARILDFGVARLLQGARHMTRTGMALGTPAYMAPEQARGTRAVDARADVYALGCVLFECLVGQPPFVGDDVMAILAKVLFDEPARLSDRLAGVPPSLDDLCARLLEKDPEKRFADGETLAAALESVADDLAPSDLATRHPSGRPPRPLTTLEQRLVAVVAIAPEGHGSEARESASTLATEAAVPAIDLAKEAARLGARFAPLADGSAIAFLEASGSATDLALRGARCALAFRDRCPTLPIAFVMGRAVGGGEVPVGKLIDRVARMISASASRAEPFALGIDELVASLLESRFDIATDQVGQMLRGERETPRSSCLLRGKESPFVGRSREIRMLEALHDECMGDSLACVSLVTGAAGVGKSRLVNEWLARATAVTESVVWFGRGDPMTAGSPLGLVAALVRSGAGVAPGDAAEVSRNKLSAWAALHLERPASVRVAAFLSEMLGVPSQEPADVELAAARSDATLMGDQMRRAFEDVVVAIAAVTPLIVVVEDAHWGDAASFRFLDAALRHAHCAPLFGIVVGRPEVGQSLRGLTSMQSMLHLSVGELSKKGCEQFVEAALQGKADKATLARVVEQSGGNAFFLEELVRFVAEGRASELPATVLAMVQTRLESLAPELRRTLRAASVCGLSFWPDAVLHLLGQTSSSGSPGPDSRAGSDALSKNLLALTAAELIETATSSRFPGRQELNFRQAMVRDAAYEMLTPRDRVAGHRLVAEWLEAAGEPDAMALAEHLERGGAALRAVTWLSRAAAQALDGHDFTGALSLVGRARRAAGDDTASRGELLLLESEALRWKGDMTGAGECATAALAALAPGSRVWFSAAAALASLTGLTGDFQAAAVLADRIGNGPCDEDAKSLRLLALSHVGRRLFQMGDYDSARNIIRLVREGLASLPGPVDPRLDAELARLVGASARHVGDVAGDLAGYQQALQAFERAGDVRGSCNTRVSLAFSYIQLGAYARGRVELEQALEGARRLGLPNVETRAHQNLALIVAAEHDFAKAIELADRVVTEAKSRGDDRFEAWTRIYLSRFAYSAGDFGRAKREAEQALANLAGSPPALAGALAALALALVALGEPGEAALKAREASAILKKYDGIEEFESLVWLAVIRAARARDEHELADGLSARAAKRLSERAAPILDAELRRSFLEEVADSADILAEAKRARPLPAISEVWSGRAFREDAAFLVDVLADHIDQSTARKRPVVSGFKAPNDLLGEVSGAFGEGPIMTPAELCELILARSPAQHHPRYIGHQVSAAIPRAASFALVGAVVNNGMAAFESGPLATMMERRVVDLMLGLIGWAETGGGVLTSGGSLGNLTALLSARHAKAGFDVRALGVTAGEPLAILASEQVHYSIERAAQIMGLGREAVIPVPTDARFRVDPAAIHDAVERARAKGRRPIAMVASAGATGTGSVDPLDRIADACDKHEIWFHVDGAHGASALLSPRHAKALRGIQRADSVVWDAHKLMSMPALVTLVAWKNGRAGYGTFAQDAAYLFRGDDERWFDVGLRTIECTKPLLAFPLYACLATLGIRIFRDAIDTVYELARTFAGKLGSLHDFELACEPDSNIVCFRHLERGGDDTRQRHVIQTLRREGTFYIVETALRGKVHLRISLMNPLTTISDLEALIEAIRAVE